MNEVRRGPNVPTRIEIPDNFDLVGAFGWFPQGIALKKLQILLEKLS